ncbi:MAG: Mur ligase family protein [Candidatus Gottesmanbacteria bacterium]|nr:Mur ligase family protein [Candidatus Gottesmanbacteria bacterium]
MEVFFFLIPLLWGIRIVSNILTYTQLWWVKEYRWDRMFIHLHTAQGKRLLWPERRRPRVLPKSALIVLFSLIFLGSILLANSWPILLRLFAMDLLSFPMTWIIVAIVNAPTNFYHKFVIAKAVSTLRHHKPMVVIGVTGSYGKTTTKEYLSTILSEKFQVLKTDASKNSPIGIAEVIVQKLKPEHEVFVVEMGAYKKGEIAEMVAMVQPQIGIITAINEQHQDLFGTIENTMHAKYELIEGLTGRNIAIMNGDDTRVSVMAQWARRDGREVWEYGSQKSKVSAEGGSASGRKSQKSNTASSIFIGTDIKASFNGIEFTCISGNTTVRVKAPVIGTHQVGNILCAIAGAGAAGMTLVEAAAAARTIQSNPKSLGTIPGINGSIYINDTFNNSPDSAIAALDVLAWGKRKKFLVFQPMIELGTYASERHASVGTYAARTCDEIMLTNDNFYEDFKKGVRTVSKTMNVSVLSPGKAASFLRSKLGKDDVVLFKGKEAEHVLRAL